MPRHFVRISEEELAKKIENAYQKADGGYHCWRDLTGQVEKDLSKCEFDLENVATGPGDFGPSGLMGYQTLDNGFTFRGMCAGGDWESPVFFIIYWDGKKLRAYIPIDGNPWNTDTKMAYGNACSYSHDYSDGRNLLKRYPNIFSGMTAKECNESNWKVNFESKKIIGDIKERIKEK